MMLGRKIETYQRHASDIISATDENYDDLQSVMILNLFSDIDLNEGEKNKKAVEGTGNKLVFPTRNLRDLPSNSFGSTLRHKPGFH